MLTHHNFNNKWASSIRNTKSVQYQSFLGNSSAKRYSNSNRFHASWLSRRSKQMIKRTNKTVKLKQHFQCRKAVHTSLLSSLMTIGPDPGIPEEQENNKREKKKRVRFAAPIYVSREIDAGNRACIDPNPLHHKDVLKQNNIARREKGLLYPHSAK